MQHPRLHVGLMGFDAVAQARVTSWLRAREAGVSATDREDDQHPVWEVADFREADALLICGAGVVAGSGKRLEFHAHFQKAYFEAPYSQMLHPIGVDLAALKQPFAISDLAHLQGLNIETTNCAVFDLESPALMQQTLRIFEATLRPLRTLFALASELHGRRDELDMDHTFHLERNGILDAIVDAPRHRVLLSPGARPTDMTSDTWARRPKSANYAPKEFLECSMDELAWVYGLYSQQHFAPKRYKSKRIYVRQSPRVRPSLIYARHIALLEHLHQGGATAQQLEQVFPDTAHLLDRDLCALYHVRAITTTAPERRSADVSSLLPLSGYSRSISALSHDKRLRTINAELSPSS
jgi:hypothetical protein